MHVAAQSYLVRTIYGDDKGLARLLPSLYQYHVIATHAHVSPLPHACLPVVSQSAFFAALAAGASTQRDLYQRGRKGIQRGEDLGLWAKTKKRRPRELDGARLDDREETSDEEQGVNDSWTSIEQPSIYDLPRAGEASTSEAQIPLAERRIRRSCGTECGFARFEWQGLKSRHQQIEMTLKILHLPPS
ncbi:hypothetical protein ACLOJK_027317 [Asimina triloba]